MPEENARPAVVAEPKGAPETWRVLLIEDDPEARRQIKVYFASRQVAGRSLDFQEIEHFDEAFKAIRERKADLVILDIYRGKAAKGGERIGEQVLSEIKRSGFVPVVIYTNLPEGLEGSVNEFVRLVPKVAGDVAGVKQLQQELDAIFATNVPQMHRAIAGHLDRTLCLYMWGFVVENWPDLSEIAGKPEFLRLLLQRLALSFAREGVDATITEVFGPLSTSAKPATDLVHPAEFYVKPPLGLDPILGDVRLRERGGEKDYLIVLWPTCDMVSTGGRTPKTDTVLCAKAFRLETLPEAEAYRAEQSKTAHGKLEDLLRNTRQTKFGNPDRFHFLPGILDLPDLVADFQALEVLGLEAVKSLKCLGSLTSPYAEQLGSRFDRYRGRIGTPDLNCGLVIQKVVSQPGTPKS